MDLPAVHEKVKGTSVEDLVDFHTEEDDNAPSGDEIFEDEYSARSDEDSDDNDEYASLTMAKTQLLVLMSSPAFGPAARRGRMPSSPPTSDIDFFSLAGDAEMSSSRPGKLAGSYIEKDDAAADGYGQSPWKGLSSQGQGIEPGSDNDRSSDRGRAQSVYSHIAVGSPRSSSLPRPMAPPPPRPRSRR
jgi:hypothetical protein